MYLARVRSPVKTFLPKRGRRKTFVSLLALQPCFSRVRLGRSLSQRCRNLIQKVLGGLQPLDGEVDLCQTLIRRVSMLEILSSRRTSYRRTLQQRAQGCAMRIRKIMSRAGASGVTVFDWDDTLFPSFVICSRPVMTMELW